MSPIKSGTQYVYSNEEIVANLPHGLDNIISSYKSATEHELLIGLFWYPNAKIEAERIAALYDIPILTVVKVACALSPKMLWENNMKAAEACIRHYVSGGYIPSITPYVNGTAKIQRTPKMSPETIVITESPDFPTVSALGALKANILKALWILQGYEWVLRGPKVQSFCDNILKWDSSQLVTVDSHAMQVWMGQIAKGTYNVPEAYYQIITADYQRAAQILGVSPLQCQAVTWGVKKNRSNGK